MLEIFYHAIAILTSRYRDWNPVTASNAASIRQALSTLRVLQIVEETALSELPALPVIPYTMTLCLSVTYRQCRAFSTAAANNRAKRHLNIAYCVLGELSTQWWNAEAMAKLGGRAIARVLSSVPASSAANATTTRMPLSNESLQRSDASSDSDTATSAPGESTTTDRCGPQMMPMCTPLKVPVAVSDNPEGVSEVSTTNLIPISTNSARPPEPTAPNIDYDCLLLDSIPNLMYPGSGMTDDIFSDVSIYDGFEAVFAAGGNRS